MKLQSLASSALVLLSAVPCVLSAAVEPASALGNFEEQVFEGKARAFDAHSVADVIASHPLLSESTTNCDSEGKALGKCLVEAGEGASEINDCAMCFLSTLDPSKHVDCAGLEAHDWCKALDTCMTQNCSAECNSEFVAGSNCILTDVGCIADTEYQCPTPPPSEEDEKSSFSDKGSRSGGSPKNSYSSAAAVAAMSASKVSATVAVIGLGLMQMT
mmetsp:Transcript_37012/g.66604  ORF Transcript_37012/g.66604 Transcript_37012/m.66604 type:complete len:216 (+) Transcript_37012:55-702(+)